MIWIEESMLGEEWNWKEVVWADDKLFFFTFEL